MDSVGSSAGASSSSSAGLESQSDSKKIKVHVESIYSCNSLYKKTKLPGVSGGVMDSLDSLISVDMLHSDGVGLQRSWGSKVDSEEAGVSKVSDAKNLESAVAEKTNYMNSNASKTDKMEDNLPKAISFAGMSDDNTKLVLPGAKFAESNWLPSVISRVLERCIFEPVKLFALDIELLNVSEKTNSNKLISIKKIFYRIDGFEGASTLLKFSGIIRSTFTSGSSLNKARKMVINEKIIVNNNLKKINNHSDQEIIIKEIPVDLPKLAIEAVFSKFGKIISIKMQLIGLWQKALVKFESIKTACLVASKWSVLMGKDSVRVALAISDKKLWILRDCYRTLLYTLLVGTTAHNLSELCVVICFESKASKLAAIGSVPVFKGVSLQWAGFFLASCTQYKQFGHIIINCSLGGNSGVCEKQVFFNQDQVYLAGIYKKKLASISHPMFFTGKTWA
ncbi:hypothetical protein G9A89_019878 [Geosiphon pyriformis]|nr:hypothetical protein G9A89_019878 [Geosiphon pyriformis]